MIIVDRPHPTEHEYKSIKFIVSFGWGQQESQIPIHSYVEIVDSNPRKINRYEPISPWSSLDEAREEVIARTKELIDRNEHLDFSASS